MLLLKQVKQEGIDMKVWIVIKDWPYESNDNIGVFSTEKKAKKFIAKEFPDFSEHPDECCWKTTKEYCAFEIRIEDWEVG